MNKSAQDRATSIGSSHLQTDPEDDVLPRRVPAAEVETAKTELVVALD